MSLSTAVRKNPLQMTMVADVFRRRDMMPGEGAGMIGGSGKRAASGRKA